MFLITNETVLEGNFIARPTTMADLEAVFELAQVSMREKFGKSNHQLEELRSEWESPGFEVSSNTHSVFTVDHRLIGYAEVWDTRETPVRPFVWGYVHPDYRGQGVGSYLLEWGEARARQVLGRVPEHARVVMQTDCLYTEAATKRLFEAHGLVTERRAWHMLIEFDGEPEAPVWPDGITVTTLAETQDLATAYRAAEEAFRDHRGFVNESFEAGFKRFKHWVKNDPHHDPTLWFLALSGAEIAGVSFCREQSWDDPDAGFVNTLGVRRPYRRQGLGLALLRHSFGALWRRGQKKVALGVDATSLTGATRLYEKAGMHVHFAFDLYEKELRPGVELSNQG